MILGMLWRLVYELAGIVGVDPGPLTLRELFWMVEGRQRDQWNHTAQVLSMIYNAHRHPKARAMEPAEFHPMAAKPEAVPKINDLSVLKQVFVKE